MDDLDHIFKVISDDAKLSKWAGGLGNDWTNIRSTGATIRGTNGESQGVVPFLKVANDTAVAVNQGGKRKGAMCAYLETWHLDIEDFLELRKNTGDERRRTHDMNTANWIPDLFMKRVAQNGHWTLFNPSDCPDLHDLYGRAFEARYAEYEAKAERGELPLHRKVEAVTLWRKMLTMLFETGHPWLTFKDPSNICSPQDHTGVVHSSNLCTEILLNTSEDEIAVCNLGSINLAEHIKDGDIDGALLETTIRTAMRMLDNVIDINYYPTKEARTANMRHRPVGLGLMGFQDALYMLEIPYASDAAVDFADRSMELISYHAILASTELARERGTYQTYQGSKWSRGILPMDTRDLLAQERGGYLDVDHSSTLDWDVVRAAVKAHGMRNSNTMAIAPTATISNISGVSQSIEPMYKHLFAKSNLSGEFTTINVYLVEALKKLDLWDAEMLDDLKFYDGVLTEIERIPEHVKEVFRTSFEIEPRWMIECASRRQKWIDMGQSLNLYLAAPNGKKLSDMYMLAWQKGLKTTYYLRTLAATQIEKSTVDLNRRGAQPRWMKNKSASANVKVERQTRPHSHGGPVASPAPAVSPPPNPPSRKSPNRLRRRCAACSTRPARPASKTPSPARLYRQLPQPHPRPPHRRSHPHPMAKKPAAKKPAPKAKAPVAKAKAAAPVKKAAAAAKKPAAMAKKPVGKKSMRQDRGGQGASVQEARAQGKAGQKNRRQSAAPKGKAVKTAVKAKATAVKKAVVSKANRRNEIRARQEVGGQDRGCRRLPSRSPCLKKASQDRGRQVLAAKLRQETRTQAG